METPSQRLEKHDSLSFHGSRLFQVHYLQCLKPVERTGSIERKRGSGSKAIKMILRKREVLRRAANHKTGISQQKRNWSQKSCYG